MAQGDGEPGSVANNTEFAYNFWKKHFEWQDLASLYPEIKTNRMLNFGCGCGHSDVFLVKECGFKSIVGVDTDPVRIAIANAVKNTQNENRVVFLEFDILKDNISSLGKFDSCWSSHVFEHIAEHHDILKALSKCMNPGAKMLVSVPLANAYDCPEHVCHWENAQALESYLKKYDDVIDVLKVQEKKENMVIRALFQFKQTEKK